MPSSTIDFGLTGVGAQLKLRLLRVPLYQRSYAWQEEQVSEFCSDLRNAFNNEPREHFMGTIVLSDDGPRATVIDGQQRLATTTLFLAALRDYYRAHGENNRADSVNLDYLNSYSDDEDDFIPRLQMNSEDDEFFRQFIIEDSPQVTPTRGSHPLLADAYRKLYAFIEEEASNAGTAWVARLVGWRKFIEEGLSIIFVAVATESDAFLIFETLNDRGAKLTLADLLKSYLFGRASAMVGGLDQVRERWLLALGALDTDQDLFITFLRQYWSSKYGATRERDLYKRIKENVTNAHQAVAFAGELEAASALYAALLDPGHEQWSGWGTDTKANVETLNRLGLEQNRPLLLAVLQHFPRNESKKALRLAVGWGVRGLVVGGIGGGTAEKAYCDAAVEVRTGAITSASGLLPALTSIVATDEEFARSFSTMRVPKTNISRYYLLAIERQLAQSDEPELVPNANEDEVNLEHVLPRRGTDQNWPSFPGDLKQQWVDRLGNHCLLKKSENNAIGNEPFSVKKPVLAGSSLALTNEIGSVDDWSADAIAERQARLAEIAPAVWKRTL
ncbi:DUF262 domain-containing protein [Microbacterium memoriense]|uniref:DUF262 domain-containing HNH endonuclease family protein n=1 Tax=Microbacterium memoriense TaxID=2978350 RepID=A0ABT2PB15_9MICO|nr:DUF262 domain-containing HNH endonuclease family protein [Microbacterium memoriense]MCT9001675.1 DUF262 domain-containing HNH endonuclease family protein [Microbacterium memoriense]